MPEKHLQVELLAFTPEPEKTCALAARTCYSAMEYDELKALVNDAEEYERRFQCKYQLD